MRRATLLATIVFTATGCSPELGDTPFACASEGACPEGYACQSSVCVRSGVSLPASHPRRATWINAGEMYWTSSRGGGAVLVVNDGFTLGAHGIYEITVAPDGVVGAPRTLLAYGHGSPVASSVVELSDGRYGVATLSFPGVEEDDLTLKVLGIEREVPAGSTPSIETLYQDTEPYLGGSEPAYVSAAAGDGIVDVAWTRPGDGGVTEVVRIARQGSVWSAVGAAEKQLPEGILPLSGDCLLWRTGKDELVLRVGFERFAVAAVNPVAGTVSDWTLLDDIPLFAWKDRLLLLRRGERDEATKASSVSYVLAGLDGAEIEVEGGGVLQDSIEPHTATAHEGAALIAPLSGDPSFRTLEVGRRSPSEGLARVASITRESSEDLYSARAFASGGRVYLAWTQFHESQMDLWVAVADLSPAMSGALVRAPERVASWRGASPPTRALGSAWSAWRRP